MTLVLIFGAWINLASVDALMPWRDEECIMVIHGERRIKFHRTCEAVIDEIVRVTNLNKQVPLCPPGCQVELYCEDGTSLTGAADYDSCPGIDEELR